jgi:putative ABC transport system permease protein
MLQVWQSACCFFIMIALYVMDEISYDRFYPNADRNYRIQFGHTFWRADLHMPVTSDMMG